MFDFATLGTVESAQKLPPELLSMDQQPVLVAGYISGRDDTGTPPQLMVSGKSWDSSQTPTIYNTIPAYPQNKAQMPPLWKDQVIMKGSLHVEKNAELWPQYGIVSLQEAVQVNTGAGGIKTDTGPVLSFWEEILLLAACLYWAFRKKKSTVAVESPPA